MSNEDPSGMSDATRADITSRRSVLRGVAAAGLSLVGGSGAAWATAPAAGFEPRRWWLGDYRIVQTNLREIDARENPREIARAVRAFGGNVIVSNMGGIVSFYPTRLAYHYADPYLSGDFVRAMIDAAHAEGIAYVGRFDLSKAMKPVYDAHPDWFMLNRDGTPREYAGTYQACPNGGWAQDYGLQILKEGLTRYMPDGVFFNMTGYPRTDYSNVDHGICVCQNCRRVFRAMYGRELPQHDGFKDPAWADYLMFQQRTSAALAEKTERFARPLIPGVPILRWDGQTQVGRGELQRRVDRAAPEWAYQAGEQSRVQMARNPGKPWSATSTAHVDYPWRQVTETAAYHQLRMAQSLGVGAHLDLYLMGTLADQNDQSWLPPVSALYKWQAANADAYRGMAPAARVGLYHSQKTDRMAGATPYGRYQVAAFRGAYEMLVDSRIPFQVVSDERVEDGSTTLIGRFDALVLANVMMMSAAEAKAIDAFVAAGGFVVATGMTGGYDPAAKAVAAVPLASFPLAAFAKPEIIEGWTLDPASGDLAIVGRVPLDGTYFGGIARAGATTLLRFAPDQRFGPPEFSYAIPGAAVRTSPGVSMLAYGRGHAVHIPWLIGWEYYRDGLPVHQQLVASLIDRFAPPARLTLTGTGPVELMALHRPADRTMLIHLVNYAGQRNGRYDPAPALGGFRLGVRGAAGRARALVAGQALAATPDPKDAGLSWFEVPPVGAFEAVLIAG